MKPFQFVDLGNRGLIRVGGADAVSFLQNLITCDMDDIDKTGAGFGALLTPQGKILFDFLIIRHGEGYLLDTPLQALGDLAKRLTFYRLRAKVDIDPLNEDWRIVGSWGTDEDLGSVPATTIEDPRLADLGQRHYGEGAPLLEALTEAGGHKKEQTDYDRHRIGLMIPEGLTDFAFSDIFPHDAGMDQLNGVSFTKGCYVGQEVVSRMQHRANARKRMIGVSSKASLPDNGTDILADGKSIGTLRSSILDESIYKGIALIRLDKAAAAHEKGVPFLCGETEVALSLPAWAGFGWPGEAASG